MARVIGMERQMGFDRSSRGDALDLADLHTTRSVISTSLKIKRDHEAAFQTWKRDINGRIQTLIYLVVMSLISTTIASKGHPAGTRQLKGEDQAARKVIK